MTPGNQVPETLSGRSRTVCWYEHNHAPPRSRPSSFCAPVGRITEHTNSTICFLVAGSCWHVVPLKPSHGPLVSQQPPAVPCGRHPVRPYGMQSQPLPCQLHLKRPFKQSQHLCKKLTPGARRQVPFAWLLPPAVDNDPAIQIWFFCGVRRFVLCKNLARAERRHFPTHTLRQNGRSTEWHKASS